MELLPPWLLLASVIASLSACIPIIIVSIIESVEGVCKNSRFFPYIWFVSFLTVVYYYVYSATTYDHDYILLTLMLKQQSSVGGGSGGEMGGTSSYGSFQSIISTFAIATSVSITFYLLIFLTVNFLLSLNKLFHLFVSVWLLAFSVTLLYIIITTNQGSVIRDNLSDYLKQHLQQ